MLAWNANNEDDKKRPLLFLYNKKKKNFDLLSAEGRNNKSIDHILRHGLITNGLFDVDKKEKKIAVTVENGSKSYTTQLPEKNKLEKKQQFTEDLEKQNGNHYFWLIIFILCIFAVALLIFYVKFAHRLFVRKR